jgi:hypothetical protein
MKFKNRISLFVASFLIIGFFFLALPEEGISGTNGITSLGCCLHDPSGLCVGCELADCAIAEDGCQATGDVYIEGNICVDGTPVECVDPFDDPGCCVISAGNCIENQTLTLGVGCDGEGGTAWFLRTDCSEVPECAPLVTNVPTLSGWGFISLAVVLGVLGIAGFMVIRRRKVNA